MVGLFYIIKKKNSINAVFSWKITEKEFASAFFARFGFLLSK